MTATDELRAMLDERGVEWRKTPHYSSDSVDNETVFCGEGIEWLAHDHLNGKLGLKTLRYEITPAQVIAATLGAGTCKRVFYRPTGDFVCSECGMGISKKLDKYCFLHFCPYCGRRVVDE